MIDRVRWCSDAQAIAYRAKGGEVAEAEVGALFAEAMAFLPDARPLTAVTQFAINARRDAPEAGDELVEFILGWLDTDRCRAEFDWQKRADLV